MNTKMTQKLLAEVEKLPFDLEDVEKFERFHKSYCNGTYIRAVAKKDVCDEWAYDGYTLKRKGKYSLHATWEILGKDFPKFRKFVLELLTEKENFKTTTHGINGGTPAAMSYVYSRYELPGEKIIEALKEDRK